MKKLLPLIALFSVYILIFNSCKKCVQNNLGTVTFTQTELQIVPYTGTETLMFLDSLGDSLTFKGNGRRDYGFQWFQCPQGDCPGAGGEDDCRGNYYFTEENITAFYSNKSYIYRVIQLYFSMDQGTTFHQNIKKNFSIEVGFYDKKYWDFDWGYNIDGLKLSTSNGGNLSFKDSIIVGPKKFYSVYVLEQISTSSSYANLQYVYYTFKEGVVGFKEQGGKTWYLSN